MAWANSKIYPQTILDVLAKTSQMDLNTGGDTFYVALFNSSITPAQDVTAANTALGSGVWASGQVSDAAEWPAGGQALDTVDLTRSVAVLKWDAADEVSTGTSATLADVNGCLIYNYSLASPVDNQGICYLYFGGANSVTDGTFTVVFNSAGIFTLTL